MYKQTENWLVFQLFISAATFVEANRPLNYGKREITHQIAFQRLLEFNIISKQTRGN